MPLRNTIELAYFCPFCGTHQKSFFVLPELGMEFVENVSMGAMLLWKGNHYPPKGKWIMNGISDCNVCLNSIEAYLVVDDNRITEIFMITGQKSKDQDGKYFSIQDFTYVPGSLFVSPFLEFINTGVASTPPKNPHEKE